MSKKKMKMRIMMIGGGVWRIRSEDLGWGLVEHYNKKKNTERPGD